MKEESEHAFKSIFSWREKKKYIYIIEKDKLQYILGDLIVKISKTILQSKGASIEDI